MFGMFSDAAALETGRPFPRALEADALGISARHYRRIRARERQGQAEWANNHPIAHQLESETEIDADRPGAEALPYVPLIYEPTHGLHYRLDLDQASVLPECPFRCANATGHGWRVHQKDDRFTTPETPRQSRHKFRPRLRRKRNRDACA
jgi:hypothetical protein